MSTHQGKGERSCVVTGAARGIGRGIAERLVADGHAVVITDLDGDAVGRTADLVLFRARTWTELLARPQADRTVLRAGRAIDRTLPDYSELDDLEGLA